MAQFDDWCDAVDGEVGAHFRRVMTGRAGDLGTGVGATAAIVPGHYASEEHVARALRRLGKSSSRNGRMAAATAGSIGVLAL